MYILEKYIIRQHIGPFFFGFFIITLLFILNLIFSELGRILNKGLEFGIIIEFFALNLAWIVTLAVPMSVLMACLMAFGRLASDNEITALKSVGISLYRLIFPAVFAAAILSVFLIWYENNILPEANHQLRLLSRAITLKRPTINLQPGYLFTDIPNFSIKVDHLLEYEGFSLVRNVLIHDVTDPNIKRSISAKRGEIQINESHGLKITLFEAELHELNLHELGQYYKSLMQKLVIYVPMPDILMPRFDSGRRGDREQNIQMMKSEIIKNSDTMQKRKQELLQYIDRQFARYFLNRTDHPEKTYASAVNEANLSNKKTTHAFNRNLINQVQTNQKILQRIRAFEGIIKSYEMANNKFLVEINKKFCIPLSCIIFVLIGTPLGILANKGSFAFSGGISLIFFIIYWCFIVGGEELADRAILSPMAAMWTANIIVGGFGIFLTISTVKEVSLLTPFRFSTVMRGAKNLQQRKNELAINLPRESYRELAKVISNLAANTKTKLIIFANRDGKLITLRSKATNIDVMHLSSFIAGSFSATTAFSEIIGEKQNFKIFFHEGVDSHIYICNILDRYLLTLIYNSNAELGMIRYYTSQALSKLEKILLPIEADE